MESKSIMRIKALRQAAAVVVIACVLAVGTNFLRQNGIPFVGDWSTDVRFSDDSGQSLVISLKKASRMYAESEAVFVDARPEYQYDQGHIKGAVSLPWQKVNERFMEVAGNLEGEKTIICYCNGENCELSHELALFLSDMGFEDVRVLVNGWTVWRRAGLAIQKKEKKDLDNV
ncbi:MAG: rhodanese-like domain-containing protein [Desulfobacteraceae bacterium]|nr:rhodanese-like domain-containing protein [Desulfobacteraceae bacterium]